MHWLAFMFVVGFAGADEPTENTTATPEVVVARVDQVEIFASDVDRELKRSLRGRKLAPAVEPAFRASTLEKLVNRELVIGYLSTTSAIASKSEVDQLWQQLQERLESRNLNVEEHLAKSGLRDESHWRHEASWNVSWARFLNRYVTDENLERHFKRYRRHFDGSEVLTSHILWTVKGSADREQAIQKANAIRKAILAKSTTFAAAAKTHSAAPTGEDGGDIGWIDRRKTMPEAFSKTAFDLKVGEVSEPISTKFGIHLVQIREVREGNRTWKESRQELTQDVKRWLFDWAAEKQRDKAKVSFTGQGPYWQTVDGIRRLNRGQR